MEPRNGSFDRILGSATIPPLKKACGLCKTQVKYFNDSGVGGSNGSDVCSLAKKCSNWSFQLEGGETTVVSEVEYDIHLKK